MRDNQVRGISAEGTVGSKVATSHYKAIVRWRLADDMGDGWKQTSHCEEERQSAARAHVVREKVASAWVRDPLRRGGGDSKKYGTAVLWETNSV